MAKKRATKKTSGYGSDELDRMDALSKEVKKQQAQGNLGQRNAVTPLPIGRFSPEAQRMMYGRAASDKLSGRTPEFGTRSLLEGMKSFMRGGGLRSGRM